MFGRLWLGLVLVVFFCGVSVEGEQTIIEPLDRVVALAGVIRQVRGYGPPGYGENKKTDSRITYWVLDVPTPVNTFCEPERPEWESVDCRATKRLRLFFPTFPLNNGLELKAKKFEGHSAVVSGVLHRQHTLGEITPIYMNVTDIQPTGAPKKH